MTSETLEQSGPLTIVELEAKENVTPDDILATMKDYAKAGDAIRANAVLAAIERCNPTEDQLREIQAAALQGVEVQATNSLNTDPGSIEAGQTPYAKVAGYIEQRLEQPQ